MDWLTFIVELVKALAWPLAVLLVFVVIRRPLLGLFPSLVRLKYKDLEFDFGRRLEETAAEVATLPAPQHGALPEATDDRLLRLAESSPRAAILEAWIKLESAAMEAARKRRIDIPTNILRTPLELINFLEEEGIIDARQATIFNELRGLRNSAAHALSFEPSTAAAIEYVRLAGKLERSLLTA